MENGAFRLVSLPCLFAEENKGRRRATERARLLQRFDMITVCNGQAHGIKMRHQDEAKNFVFPVCSSLPLLWPYHSLQHKQHNKQTTQAGSAHSLSSQQTLSFWRTSRVLQSADAIHLSYLFMVLKCHFLLDFKQRNG